MTDYHFAGGAYRNQREMHDAIVETYLCADGLNDRATMLTFFTDMTDEELAEDCWKNWFGEWAPEGETGLPTNSAVDRDELLKAFTRLRREFDQRFPDRESA